MLPILSIFVNNIEQVVEPECSPQSGVTMLNNIFDNIKQCGQHNIVQSCFQQPVATQFLAVYGMIEMCLRNFAKGRLRRDTVAA